MTVCEFIWRGNDKIQKLFCKTHEQFLMYVYRKRLKLGKEHGGVPIFLCQVGEDEIYSKKIKEKAEATAP
jgi:hypothetical protein